MLDSQHRCSSRPSPRTRGEGDCCAPGRRAKQASKSQHQQHRMVVEIETTQRIARLTPLDAVLNRIDALVGPVAPREVEIRDAVGRVVADDVMGASVPGAALALRDGWAVNSALTQDAGPYAPAPPPSAIRIDAGARMPAGAHAVAEIGSVA